MKKLLLFVAIILGINGYSQDLFITINPQQGFMNPGVLYHQTFDGIVGLYGNFSYGDVNLPDFYAVQFKSSYGFGYTVPNSNKDVTVLMGFSQTWWRDVKDNNPIIDLNDHKFNAFSIGFFANLPTKRKMSILFYTDVVNWESQIGLGINLNKN